MLQKSTTLNRRYVRRPGSFTTSIPVSTPADAPAPAPLTIPIETPDEPVAKAPVTQIAITQPDDQPVAQPAAKSPLKIQISKSIPVSEDVTEETNSSTEPQPIKEAQITQPEPEQLGIILDSPLHAPSTESIAQTALSSSMSRADSCPPESERPVKTGSRAGSKKMLSSDAKASPLADSFKKTRTKRKKSRLALAFLTSAACVAALGYLVHLNIPDISVKVAALQTGIEASYPSYVPRGFQLSSVFTDQDNRIIMEFTGENNTKFTISEEKSAWDSTALLNNYVKQAWADAYTVVREQGISIYIANSGSAAWVNGGILYRIDVENGTLTKKQIKNIVTSL